MDRNRLASLLRCVECGSSEMRCEPKQASYNNCGQVFTSVNGIYDLRPPQQLPHKSDLCQTNVKEVNIA